MTQTPQFKDFTGALTTFLEFSSTRREHTFTGEVSPGTVDIQVNLNRTGFVSDPNMISFDQDTFTVPNPNVYPEGFVYEEGLNSLQIRAIDASGQFSPVAEAVINVLDPDDALQAPPPPSGLRLRRLKDSVEVVWAETNWPGVIGYHVYASTDPSSQGYVRVNKDLITEPSFEEESLIPITSDTAFFDNSYGQLRIFLGEEDYNEIPMGPPVQDSIIDISLAGPHIKVDTSIQSVQTIKYFSFRHNRMGGPNTINSDLLSGIPLEEPLYYVITSVSMQRGKEEGESAYSSELEGAPLIINTQQVEPPQRTRFDVSEEYIAQILQYDPEISVIPGSVVRDVFIDPFATEAERLYFIADFVRRTQSFSTLLVIDRMPSYKQALASALGLTAIDSVQAIIDDAFDKLATNVNVQRLGARPSVGTVTFYTAAEPQGDIHIAQGTIVSGAGSSFKVTSGVTLPYDMRQSYYNQQRRRWEIRANIQATLPGSQGNVAAHKINQATGGLGGTIQVINMEATAFGQDLESNEDLATRAILAFSSVDTGTASGYLATALKRSGVIKAIVIDAGHPYMARDYDPVRQRNIGGKVDVWVQGSFVEQVSDTFALGYNIITGAPFILVSDPSDLIFEVDDPRLSPDNPITEVMSDLHNLRSGVSYDISNYTVIDYNRIQLDTSLAQPLIGVNDPVVGDLKWRSNYRFVFSRQPVSGVNHVISLSQGASQSLGEGTHYDLFQKEDPLLEGYSTRANDYLQIRDGALGVALGVVQTVIGEFHILLGDTPVPLLNLGVHPSSVEVKRASDGHPFTGPSSGVLEPDYFIFPGDEVTPFYISRNPNGQMADGEEVEVDYEHDENFEVSYNVNTLLQNVQKDLDSQRHVTADVLAKEVITNPIDMDMVITLKTGAERSEVDGNVRTNISKVLSSYGIGEPVHQSDIVQAIENTEGVSHVVIPLSRMSHRDGNLIVREKLSSTFSFVGTGAAGLNIYVLDQGLRFNTRTGGGQITKPVGVFKGQEEMSLVSNPGALFSRTEPAAAISGREGSSIIGFTDNNTLIAEGYTTPTERAKRREELSGNKIFLTLPASENHSSFEWEVTYQVWGEETESYSTIQISGISKAVLGDVSITYVT